MAPDSTPAPAAPPPRSGRLTLVLGGARSGKSTLAERLVTAYDGPLTYVATGEATDEDMAARIEAHRASRDPRFETVEAGGALAAAVRALPDRPALIDALGTWLAAPAILPLWSGDPVTHATEGGANLDDVTGELVEALAARTSPTVVVSDETGLGVHPETEAGRRWRDALGVVNQRVADIADGVLLVVAGRILRLDRPDDIGLRLGD